MQSLTLARLAGGVSIRPPHQWHQPTRTVLVVVVVPGQVSENLMRVRLRSLYFPFLPLRSENYLEEGSWVLTVYAEPLNYRQDILPYINAHCTRSAQVRDSCSSASIFN